jgi:hypothetical protein
VHPSPQLPHPTPISIDDFTPLTFNPKKAPKTPKIKPENPHKPDPPQTSQTAPKKVGDFNLSRYVGRGDAFVKSSLENNPRWSAPEVVAEGRFSKARSICFPPHPHPQSLSRAGSAVDGPVLCAWGRGAEVRARRAPLFAPPFSRGAGFVCFGGLGCSSRQARRGGWWPTRAGGRRKRLLPSRQPPTDANRRPPQAADVYSFGVVLWELLTWQEPWGGANAFHVRGGCWGCRLFRC